MVHIKKNGGQVGKEYALEVKLLHSAHIHCSLVMGGGGVGWGAGVGGAVVTERIFCNCALFSTSRMFTLA